MGLEGDHSPDLSPDCGRMTGKSEVIRADPICAITSGWPTTRQVAARFSSPGVIVNDSEKLLVLFSELDVFLLFLDRNYSRFAIKHMPSINRYIPESPPPRRKACTCQDLLRKYAVCA